jgi:dUTP pyrophosphatase
MLATKASTDGLLGGIARLMTAIIPIRRLPHADGLPLPAYETAGAAGMDLRAAIPDEAPVTLAPGARAMVPTGLIIAVPAGFEAQVRPRSGLAARAGVSCLNTPGTIDSDYRGEVQVILINLGEASFTVKRGDRIAQMVICPVVQARWVEVGAHDETARGTRGFGSTGV